MQLIAFFASFFVILLAVCSFIPYAGILAILLCLLMGLLVLFFGVISKVRFAWISSLVSMLVAIVAVFFQLVYLAKACIYFGGYLVEQGHWAWVEYVTPSITSFTEFIAPELSNSAQRHDELVEYILDYRKTLISEGLSENEASQKVIEIYKQLTQEQQPELPTTSK